MKKLKKLGAALLAVAMLVSLLPTAFAAEDASVWETRSKDGLAARFAVFSDSHLITDTKRLDLALQSFTNIGGIDGMMMVGDIVYMNKKDILYPERYTLLNETINKYDAIKNLPIAYVMGNHEFPEGTTDAAISADSQAKFIEGIGLTTERTGVQSVSGANAVYEMGGYTVVAASPEAYSNKMTAETEAWAKEALLAAIAANPTEPVFYLQHQPIQNTVRSSSSAVNSDEFMTWIKSQPHIINFTAHCHYSAYDPQSIWQSDAGFTAIHSPLLGGGYLSGLVGSFERSNITDAAYALIVEIDTNNVVRVYKLDLYNGEEVGSPYVINVNSTERLYTDARFETANAPVFQNNEEVTVDNVTGHSATVTFPDSAVMTESVSGVSNDGFVLYWRVEAVNKATGAVSQYVNRYGDFWTKEVRDTRTVTINNLDRNTDYTINVIPVSPLLKQGAPISAEITTTNEKDATDAALISTKRLNVAAHKQVTASAPDATYVPANLTDDNRQTFVIPGPNSVTSADTFVIDLEKRYVVDTVEVYDRYNTADEGGRCCIAIDGSNDPDFATYDVLDELGPHDKIIQNAAGLNVGDHTLFPDDGCFAGSGNGKAYRYIRVRRTGGYYYGYSEIKVWANQDVTEVTRKKNVTVDNQYSSAYAGSKAVNGTVSGDSDAWVSEEGGKYHYLTVDMETPKNIGLIEMVGRNIKNPDTGEQVNTTSQRNYWQIYGSDSLIGDKSVLTDSHTLDEAATGYTKLLQTNADSNYIAGEYWFPEYPGSLQQVVSDSTPYRYITFKRGGAEATHGIGSTYLGEVRGYVLNPMINAVSEENGVVSVDFSDTMDADTINNNTIKVYDGVSEEEIAATVELSDDKYTAVITPVQAASFYKITVADEVLNLYGTDLATDFEEYTTPENNYGDYPSKTVQNVNVAQNKPVTAYNAATDLPLSNIVDGNNYTETAVSMSPSHYIQVDLLKRYNLNSIELYDCKKELYIEPNLRLGLEIWGSNDPDFASYDVLDATGDNSDNKYPESGKWTINLDGNEAYRYLRIYKAETWAYGRFAEIKAYADIDVTEVSRGKTAKANAYYENADWAAPSTVLDGVQGEVNCWLTYNTASYNWLQANLENKYHIGYIEMTPRTNFDAGAYQAFDFYGSNHDISTEETVLADQTKYLDEAENGGYDLLSRAYTYDQYYGYDPNDVSASTNSMEDAPMTETKAYTASVNDTNAYQYITYKHTYYPIPSAMGLLNLYVLNPMVNSVDVNENTVTVNFSDSMYMQNAAECISVVNAAGENVEISDVAGDDYTLTFNADLADGDTYTVTVSKEIFNEYAVPMIEDYTYTIEKAAKEALENVSFTTAGEDATALAANTEYIFAADFNNNEDTAVSVYAIVAIYDSLGRLVKVESEYYADVVASQAINVSITTDSDVTGQTAYAYVLTDDFAPIDNKIDVLTLNN